MDEEGKEMTDTEKLDPNATYFVQSEAGRAKLANYNLGIADSWIKAITEIITNSHQNYHTNWESLGFDKRKENPGIYIVANPETETFTISDNGTGIAGSLVELADYLKKYSQYIESSHTVKGRSSFGRGLSDVLFRKGIYINQVLAHKDGKCIAIEALWLNNEPIFRIIDKVDEKVIKMEIPEHGTQVTFHWNSTQEKRNFPSKKEMLDGVSRYYELKTVLNDKKVDIFLIFLDEKETPEPKKLEFVNYQKNAAPIGKNLLDIPLQIDQNYDIKIISAQLYKTNNPVLNQERGESRTGGLFIEGEHGQIYDLTLFDQEKNYRDISLRIIGEVVLSDDAKKYMDDMYTNEGTTILTRTREGFDHKFTFYKELKKKLHPWIVGILQSESDVGSSTHSEQFKEAIKKLNEIGKRLLEAKILEPGPGPEGPEGPTEPPKSNLPDTILFYPESANVEQGILTKIFLKINCEKIRPGTKVIFRKEGLGRTHFEISWESEKVPTPNKEGLAKIPIFIKCNELDATCEIVAEVQKKNGELTGDKYCFIRCIEEHNEHNEQPPTEYLEFIPTSTKVDTHVDKRINLLVHQILEPGSKIKIEFSCSTHDFEPPITFAEDGNRKIDGKNHSFEIEVLDIPLDKNAYRKLPLTFTGTGEGLKGILTAISDNPSTIPATCKIEIEFTPEEGGGIISGWDVVNNSYTMYSYYLPNETKVILNAGVSFVRKIIGKNKEEADVRCAKLQEAQVFVAHSIMDVFFDEVVNRMFETKKLVIEYSDPNEREIHEAFVHRKQQYMKEFGDEILSMFAPNLRKTGEGGEVKNIIFEKEGIEFLYWELDLEQSITLPIFMNELKEFRGKESERQIVHFETKGQTFEIAVYIIERGTFLISMHNYDKEGRYHIIMEDIDNFKQIFKEPKKQTSKISLSEPVYSAVKVTKWEGNPEHKTKLIPLRYDQYMELPDAPEMNHANTLTEKDPDWIDIDGNPIVQYAKYSDIQNSDDKFKNNMVCFVSKKDIIQMAKIFVRTKIVPAFESYNIIAKALHDVSIKCQNEDCSVEATGYSEILTKFGVHFDGNKPQANLLCKKCNMY